MLKSTQLLSDAIASYAFTANCIGVKVHKDVEHEIEIVKPAGIDDLMDLVIRPNESLLNPAINSAQTKLWQSHWPKLKIVGQNIN